MIFFRRQGRKSPVTDPILSLIPEADEAVRRALSIVKPYTMTSYERLWAMWQAVHYIAARPVEGDIVECGVWKGGNLILAGMLCESLGLERRIYGFDTFLGMSQPTEADVNLYGTGAEEKFRSSQRPDHNDWCYSSEGDVRRNLVRFTSYPHITLVVGKCEDTLRDPANVPEKIGLLRLDTDWYESTKVEIEVLFPRLEPGGILIVDDYGHWGGARQAIDEYFKGRPTFFHRLDYTGRLVVKS
jgi:hypothetical protein